MIDIHAHILPGVDDGARDMKESLRMLQQAASQGVTAVVATPHYSRQRDMPELEIVFQLLQQAVQEWNPDFQVYLGQETYYHDELADRIRQGIAHTMAGSRYVLVEFDPQVSYQTLFQGIRKLSDAGYQPILAHMERYMCLWHKENLEDICGSSCWLQMNYESLAGYFYQSEVRWCRKQVQAGRIHLLGTDMHRLDYRPPRIAQAMAWLKKHVDTELIKDMTERNALRIIHHGRL